jgi:hypothetical protein
VRKLQGFSFEINYKKGVKCGFRLLILPSIAQINIYNGTVVERLDIG